MTKIQRISALAVLFCLILSLFSACGLAPSVSDSLSENQTETEPLANPILNYTLTEEEYTAYQTILLAVKEKMLAAETVEEAEAAMEEVSERLEYFRKQAVIAELLYYCDQENETGRENYEYAANLYQTAYLDAVKLEEAVYEADPPYREEYFAGMTEEEVEQAVKETEATQEYQTLQTSLNTQFYSMSEEELQQNAANLYHQLIQQGNETAEICGYDSFYDYAAKNIYFRDFGGEERKVFRAYVKEYIVPLYREAYESFRASYSALSREDQVFLSLLMDTAPYDTLDKNYLSDFLASLSGSTREGMLDMFERGAFVCAEGDGALQGALTTTVDGPFCYFGPQYFQTTFTVAHELGHYYATLFLDSEYYALDIAETHSAGNEMLLLYYMKSELSEETYQTLVQFKIYSEAHSILIATVLDEFEERIFTDNAFATVTAETYTALLNAIAEKYGIANDLEDQLLALWAPVCITTPVYYLSYATSGIAVLNLYGLCLSDPAAAREAYRKTVEEMDATSNFVATLKNAGIPTPFEESAYTGLHALLP